MHSSSSPVSNIAALRFCTPAHQLGTPHDDNTIIEAGLYTVLDRPPTVDQQREFIANFPKRGVFLVAERADDHSIVDLHDVEPFSSTRYWLRDSCGSRATGFSGSYVSLVGIMSVTERPETSESLLLRIRDPQDRDAWYEFVSIYRPLIYRVARRYELQDADAQNLTQEVLQKVERQAGLWEPGQARGSFRRWLATVAKNAAIDAIRRVLPDTARGGTSVGDALQSVPAPGDASESEFRLELERQAFRWAARRIRNEFTEPTWEAFWETMVEGEPCADVAARLGRSIGAMYTARSRIMQRLKEELEEFDWEAGTADSGTGDQT